jgi:DNA repair exonuclease SbcCD ATPase subunit
VFENTREFLRFYFPYYTGAFNREKEIENLQKDHVIEELNQAEAELTQLRAEVDRLKHKSDTMEYERDQLEAEVERLTKQINIKDMGMNYLQSAIVTYLYDQYDMPDIESRVSPQTLVEYIIQALIEKRENICPFKNYDCIGHCSTLSSGIVFKISSLRIASSSWILRQNVSIK